MLRILAILLIILAVAPGTWLRSEPPPHDRPAPVFVEPISLPPRKQLEPHLAPFELVRAWEINSKHGRFGSYSALIAADESELVAFSDVGFMLRMALPDPVQRAPKQRKVELPLTGDKNQRDVEAATLDPETMTVWLAVENVNAILRFALGRSRLEPDGIAYPPRLSKWRGNAGPEAFMRLADGRFLILREQFAGLFESDLHKGLLFDGDPVEDETSLEFSVAGPATFSPTDIAQLPDGRALVLFRRPVWPLPPRFAARLAIGDPAEIEPGRVWRLHEVARLSSTLPVDNFEGMAISPRADGRVSVWIISDDNGMLMQRTLLWELAVDPADLP